MTGGAGRPTFFYKYRSAVRVRQILRTRVVRFGSPLEFNDPFDTHFFWRFGFSMDEARAATFARLKRLIKCDDPLPPTVSDMWGNAVVDARRMRDDGRLGEALAFLEDALAKGAARVEVQVEEMNREWQKWLRSMRVFCLGEVHDDLLMWAHYADCHRGAVIQFRKVPGKNSALCGNLRPMTYQAAIPAVADTAEEWARGVSGEAPIDMRAAFERMAFTKSDHWRHEKEWRSWDLADPGDNRLAAPCRVDAEDITAVYLGCRMKDANRDAIVRIVRDQLPHVQVYQARMSKVRFALEFDLVTAAPPHGWTTKLRSAWLRWRLSRACRARLRPR